jgi:hypothetical protein
MPGHICIVVNNIPVATMRYQSRNERKNIISFINLLYAPAQYTVNIQPDCCTENETVSQLEKAGCDYRYHRVSGVHGIGPDALYSLAI